MIHVSGMRPARRHDDAKFEHGWCRNHRNATATGRRLAPNSGRQPDRRCVALRGCATPIAVAECYTGIVMCINHPV